MNTFEKGLWRYWFRNSKKYVPSILEFCLFQNADYEMKSYDFEEFEDLDRGGNGYVFRGDMVIKYSLN